MEKIKLDENDWAVINAGRVVKVGSKEVVVKPFSIAQALELRVVIKEVIDSLIKNGVTVESIGTDEGMSMIFNHIAAFAPILIEEACGLDGDCVLDLPIATGVALVAAIIAVNLDAQGNLNDSLAVLGNLFSK